MSLKKSIKSIGILFVILLSACSDDVELASKVVGTWEWKSEVEEGGEAGRSWCVSYYEDKNMHLGILTPTLVERDDGRKELDRSLELYEGFWEILPGSRLKSTIVPLGTRGIVDADGNYPLARVDSYIVKSVDEEHMHYREEANREAWYTVRSVDECSEEHSLPIANTNLDALSQ